MGKPNDSFKDRYAQIFEMFPIERNHMLFRIRHLGVPVNPK